MTCYERDHEHSAFDLPLDLANARIDALRSEARRTRQSDDGPPVGAIRRVRHGLGLRLIALGSALAADRRPRPLAR
jgi:hypothetical protein